ncbi:MAG: glycosyltransferase [Bacilli bacterium]|nr:glycosyltransferase [Bacilli bacterium]
MKKILITAYDLNIGGIEKSLINLLNEVHNKYDITLVLEHKTGDLLDLIPDNIIVKEYKVFKYKNILIQKIFNFIKFLKWSIKNKNKYDYSVCYATYSLPGKKLALKASKNNIIWIHSNYKLIYKEDEKVREFYKLMELEKFKKCIFVSKDAYEDSIKIYPEISFKSIVCNNYINLDEIKEKSKEKININKPKETLFINVGRHDEESKRLTRLIEACNKLKNDNLKFKLLMVGDGPDNTSYKELVKKYNLEKEIIFIGSKKNPYPYYELADCVVLSSDYEGYPVVFLESLALNKPIISTKVSDYKEIEQYGFFVDKNSEELYLAMKKFILGDYNFKNNYNIIKLNNKIDEIIEKIFN